jgi:hypothetical protein
MSLLLGYHNSRLTYHYFSISHHTCWLFRKYILYLLNFRSESFTSVSVGLTTSSSEAVQK